MRAELPAPLLDGLITVALVGLTVANVVGRPGAGRVIYLLGMLTVAPLVLRQVAPVVVISLQAGLANYVFDTDRPTARAAVTTVETTSREALLEMRRLLDVLRLDDDKIDLSPQPGIEEVQGLVERVRAAGLTVDLTVTGRVRPVPPGVAISVYRIVQESLTNVLKHAGPASALVEIAYRGRYLDVRIADDGAGSRVDSGRSSYGVHGMRERAVLYGGTFEVGPRRDGGFAVVACLPIEERA